MSGTSKPQNGRTITLDSVVVAHREQVASDLGEEIVILNLTNGVYYGLDAVGVKIWHWIHEPQIVHALRDRILEEYDVERERCERDLLVLLRDMAGAGLIKVHDKPQT